LREGNGGGGEDVLMKINKRKFVDSPAGRLRQKGRFPRIRVEVGQETKKKKKEGLGSQWERKRRGVRCGKEFYLLSIEEGGEKRLDSHEKRMLQSKGGSKTLIFLKRNM